MANHYTVTTMQDHTLEKSVFKLYNGAITGASIAGFLTNYGALKTAIENICFDNIYQDMWVGDSSLITPAAPASHYAQRESKLLIRYRGATSGKLFTVTLPTVDLAKLTFVPGGKDAVDITTGAEMIALVTAIETIGRTPDSDTETITVESAQFVGRNN